MKSTRPNKTDAGNGSEAICRVSNVLRSPSPDPKRWAKKEYRMKTLNNKIAASVLTLLGAVLMVPVFGQAQSDLPQVYTPEELVLELRQFQAALPASSRSDGTPDPMEVRRRLIYDRLRTLGDTAFPALSRGLADPDVRIRGNVALFLASSSPVTTPSKPRFDIQACLPALASALTDPDARVRQLGAQALGKIGSKASSAVPGLIALLASTDEGSRNSACIGLAGIGPTAKDALPMLRKALADPSNDVRRFAQGAIEMIDK